MFGPITPDQSSRPMDASALIVARPTPMDPMDPFDKASARPQHYTVPEVSFPLFLR